MSDSAFSQDSCFLMDTVASIVDKIELGAQVDQSPGRESIET